MNEELVKIIELERKKKVKEATANNDNDDNDNIMFLQNYAVTSITQPEDCADVYDVVLAPNPRPRVRLRMRKQDLRRLADAIVTGRHDWCLDLDAGALKVDGDSAASKLVFAEVAGKVGHFYGVRKEQDGDE